MNSRQEKGFHYTLEDEKLEAYARLTTEQKLEWLEAINQLTWEVREGEENEEDRSGE